MTLPRVGFRALPITAFESHDENERRFRGELETALSRADIAFREAARRITEIEESGGGTDPGTGLPPGGLESQVLTKQSNADGDADWEYPPTSSPVTQADNWQLETTTGTNPVAGSFTLDNSSWANVTQIIFNRESAGGNLVTRKLMNLRPRDAISIYKLEDPFNTSGAVFDLDMAPSLVGESLVVSAVPRIVNSSPIVGGNYGIDVSIISRITGGVF